jgi:serine carboxypeptidase-like clade 2
MQISFLVWASLISLIAVLLIKGEDTSDFVERLPGQPAVKFKQYAGYVTVNATKGRALFYWFVEADNKKAASLPVCFWFNGGPGCSSIGEGAFTELGPFYNKNEGFGLVRNHHSWNRDSNIVFVDSPAGVGYSYSNTSSDYNYFSDELTG